jgi:hypothetical protein
MHNKVSLFKKIYKEDGQFMDKLIRGLKGVSVFNFLNKRSLIQPKHIGL